MDQDQMTFLQSKFDVSHEKTEIPFIANEKTLMNVPLSSVAVWIDPLDATKEFTGLFPSLLLASLFFDTQRSFSRESPSICHGDVVHHG